MQPLREGARQRRRIECPAGAQFTVAVSRTIAPNVFSCPNEPAIRFAVFCLFEAVHPLPFGHPPSPRGYASYDRFIHFV